MILHMVLVFSTKLFVVIMIKKKLKIVKLCFIDLFLMFFIRKSITSARKILFGSKFSW